MLLDDILDINYMEQLYDIALLLLSNILLWSKLNIAATFCNSDCTVGGLLKLAEVVSMVYISLMEKWA